MWTVMPSPIGDLRIVERDGSIVAIEFSPFKQSVDGRPLGARSDDEPVLAEAVRQLTAYFGRELTEFDLPLAPGRAPSSRGGCGSSSRRSPTARPRPTARSPAGSG